MNCIEIFGLDTAGGDFLCYILLAQRILGLKFQDCVGEY
jgi:hypothetical protein